MSVSGYRAIAGKVRGRWSALNELKLANDLVRLNTNQRLTAVNAVPIRALTWTRAAVYALLGSKNAGRLRVALFAWLLDHVGEHLTYLLALEAFQPAHGPFV